MNVSGSISTSMKTSLGSFFSDFFSRAVSLHVKQVIFAVTLYMHLSASKRMDRMVMAKLNTVFEQLVRENGQAFEFPSLLTPLVWKDDARKEDLTCLGAICGADLDLLISQVIARCPAWLKYDLSQMREDTRKVIRMIQEMNQPKATAVGEG